MKHSGQNNHIRIVLLRMKLTWNTTKLEPKRILLSRVIWSRSGSNFEIIKLSAFFHLFYFFQLFLSFSFLMACLWLFLYLYLFYSFFWNHFLFSSAFSPWFLYSRSHFGSLPKIQVKRNLRFQHITRQLMDQQTKLHSSSFLLKLVWQFIFPLLIYWSNRHRFCFFLVSVDFCL